MSGLGHWLQIRSAREPVEDRRPGSVKSAPGRLDVIGVAASPIGQGCRRIRDCPISDIVLIQIIVSVLVRSEIYQ